MTFVQQNSRFDQSVIPVLLFFPMNFLVCSKFFLPLVHWEEQSIVTVIKITVKRTTILFCFSKLLIRISTKDDVLPDQKNVELAVALKKSNLPRFTKSKDF